MDTEQNIQHKRLVSYALLDALEKEKGQNGFDYLFIPLVKKGLVEVNKKGLKMGANILEIKTELQTLFGLDFPIPFLKKLLIIISKQFQEELGGQLIIHKDNSFQFEQVLSEKLKLNNKTIKDFELIITKEENLVKNIEILFQKFLEINDVKNREEISLIEFIELNKIALSNYFAVDEFEIKDLVYKNNNLNIAAKFFREVRNDPPVFNVLKKLYVGSVYSNYLTLTPEQSSLKLELVLDTSFIVGLLKLMSEETSDVCKKIYDIGIKLGFTFTVLKITIEETQDMLGRVLRVFNSDVFERQMNPESVIASCDRQNINKEQLQRIRLKIEDLIKSKYNIKIIDDDSKYRELAKTEYKYLFDIYRRRKHTFRDFTALHDTVCDAYVLEQRGRPVFNFLTSKIWLVKGSSLITKDVFSRKKGLPPYISASSLVNILWLSNPSAREKLSVNDFTEIGITKLISSTLDRSLPSQAILQQLEKNLHILEEKNVDITDCVIVATTIAEKEYIEELNRTIEKNIANPENIAKRVNDYKNKQRKIQQDKETIWRKEIQQFIENTMKGINREKEELEQNSKKKDDNNSELKKQIDILSEKISTLSKDNINLKKNIDSANIRREFKKWQMYALIHLFILIFSLFFIFFSDVYQSENWNPISILYHWVDTLTGAKKELVELAIVHIFFLLIGTICGKQIWNRWFSRKKKNEKLKELESVYNTK
jgi:hypothetical protein